MKFALAATVLVLAAPFAPVAAAPAPPAGTIVDDARCLVSFYFLTFLHDAKEGGVTDEGAAMARDGFIYYSGRLNARANQAAIGSAIAEALKDKSTDVKATATSCLHAMGDPLNKTEETLKAAIK